MSLFYRHRTRRRAQVYMDGEIRSEQERDVRCDPNGWFHGSDLADKNRKLLFRKKKTQTRMAVPSIRKGSLSNVYPFRDPRNRYDTIIPSIRPIVFPIPHVWVPRNRNTYTPTQKMASTDRILRRSESRLPFVVSKRMDRYVDVLPLVQRRRGRIENPRNVSWT